MTGLKTNAQTIHNALTDYLRDPGRDPYAAERHLYLGMSAIGGCPYEAYQSMVDPQPTEERMQWYHWRGHVIEADILEILHDQGIPLLPKNDDAYNVAADFDSRFRGHCDILTQDGVVIDVKTTSWRNVSYMQNNGVSAQNYDQLQAYIRHGGFQAGMLLYVPLDIPHREWDHNYWEAAEPTLAYWPVDIAPNPARQDYLDQKARTILAAVDGQLPPPGPEPDLWKNKIPLDHNGQVTWQGSDI